MSKLINHPDSTAIHKNYMQINDGKTSGIDLPPTGFFSIADEVHGDDMIFGNRCGTLPKGTHEIDDIREGNVISALNYGFVELQEVQGSDESIIQAARTSYAVGKKSSQDETLLRYLYRNLHSTPFEMAGLRVRMYIPIVTYRQLFRHRTAVQLEPEFLSNDSAFAKYSVQNEMSGRYVELPPHMYLPEARRIQRQSKTNRQGSEDDSMTPEEQQEALAIMDAANIEAREKYEQLLSMGIAKETARNVLPNTQYTLLVWKIDLKNMLHFLGLRLDKHAQWEVRQYAEAMGLFVQRFFPLTWRAFNDYFLNAVRLSAQEHQSLLMLSEGEREAVYHNYCLVVDNDRERKEFRAKLGL